MRTGMCVFLALMLSAGPPLILTASDAPPAPVPEVVARATTRLVAASAVVFDKRGNPVTDLKKEDFEVYDRGIRQNLRFFSAPVPTATRDATTAQTAVSIPAGPRGGVFSNRAEENSGDPTVILFDPGVATWEQVALAEEQIVKFLEEDVRTGDRIGLYTIDRDGIGIVHEIASDSSDLAGSAEAWFRRSTLAARIGMPAWERDRECPADVALRAIAVSANHLAAIPGRKALIWISGGHQAPVFLQAAGAQGNAASGGPRGTGAKSNTASRQSTDTVLKAQDPVQNCFRHETEALRALNRANVALYAIDLRGLQTTQPDATVAARDLAGGPAALNAAPHAMLTAIVEDQSIMRDIADHSGGRAFTETNDILGSASAAFAESHSTYTLGFYPGSPGHDGQYHQLEVKVPARPDVTVRYRRGYIDARESPDLENELRDAVQSPLDGSMIALTAEIFPRDVGGYGVNLNIGVGDLDLQGDGDLWQGPIHLVLAQRDDTGRQLDQRDLALQLRLTPSRYEALRKSGLAYHLDFSPNPKAASLRVVVLDEAGNVGSVTIPLVPPGKKLRLR